MEQPQEQPHLPMKWSVMVLFSAVPLLAAIVLLQLLGPPGGPLSAIELTSLHKTASREAFLSGVITYAVMVTIHVFVCVAAIVFARLVVRSVPGGSRLELTGFALGLGVAIAFLLIARIGDPSILIYRVTYVNFEELFRDTGAGSWLLNTRLGMTTLGLAAYVPTVLGVFAVALTTAAAVGQLSLVQRAEQSEEEWEGLLCVAASRIKRLTYALSLVLVTSNVAAALYFRLPAKLTVPPDSRPLIAQLEAYGGELTLFWGGVYTLTLVAAVGVPLLLVQQQVRSFLEALHPPERADPFRERMAKAGALSGGGDQLKMLIAFVAPLVSAPVTTFLQAATG